MGMKHVICVPEQMVMDGNFPPVVSPNPENPEGFYLAVDLAKKEGPTSSWAPTPTRTGWASWSRTTGAVQGHLRQPDRRAAAGLPDRRHEALRQHAGSPVALKTIVTTEMARKVAETNGVTCYDTFTGFKFMAEKKDQLEARQGKVIFSYEESYGYMLGDYVRDKDAVTAALLLTEMAAWYAGQGMTLYDALRPCLKVRLLR